MINNIKDQQQELIKTISKISNSFNTLNKEINNEIYELILIKNKKQAFLDTILTKQVSYVNNQAKVNDLEIQLLQLQKNIEFLNKEIKKRDNLGMSIKQLETLDSLETNTSFFAVLKQKPVVFESFQNLNVNTRREQNNDIFNTIKSNLNNEEIAVLPIKIENQNSPEAYKVIVNNRFSVGLTSLSS